MYSIDRAQYGFTPLPKNGLVFIEGRSLHDYDAMLHCVAANADEISASQSLTKFAGQARTSGPLDRDPRNGTRVWRQHAAARAQP